MTNDAELRRRLELLREYFEDGKIKIAPHLIDGFKESFGAVRYGSDGQVDLSTVDGRVRAMALAIAGMDQRDKTKEVASLRDIQNSYFEFVDHSFGDLRKEMVLANANPHSMSWAMSQHAETVDHVYPQIQTFVDALAEFWSGAEEVARYHLQDLNVTKGVYGGDLFPSYAHNIASTCGLYLDTIVLTDPFMNSRILFPRWSRPEAVRYFVKHGLNVLSYKHLALADLSPPIVAIVPFRSSIDNEEGAWLRRIAEKDGLSHAQAIFDRPFESVDELLEFARSFQSVDALVSAVRHPDRLLFDIEWKEPLRQQVTRALTESSGLLAEADLPFLVMNQTIARMMQANDVIGKSREFSGTPLMDAPTSWQYLNWKLEYDAELSPTTRQPMHVVHALQDVENKAEWLGKIPADALIDMRQQGALAEIRSVLFKGVQDVVDAEANDFEQVSSRILENLDDAYRKHREAMDELKQNRRRFYGYDIGSWLVTGTIGVAAAITANPALAVAALAAHEVLPAPTLREIPGRLKKLGKREQIQRQTPMGLLFEYKDAD
jgi:hypothetical protein